MSNAIIESTPANQPAQMKGLNGYGVTPIFTIGQEFEDGSQGDYTPVGILDGLGAYELDDNTIRVLANHELGSSSGYAYILANGTQLTGARVSFFDINKNTLELVDSGLAYDTIINRTGEIVDDPSDLEFGGFQRFCSAQYIEAYQFGNSIGLQDGMFFTGEETTGGTEYVIDVSTNTIYAVPWMGRAGWESVTEVNTGTTDKVAFLVGDDRAGKYLLMYMGTKDVDVNEDGTIDFLERNGLAGGELYAWVADNGDLDPSQFNGDFSDRDGTFVELDYYRPDLAGNGEYDELGFATQNKQDALAQEAGAFQFSRPEDVATNPFDGTQIVLASTGRDSLFDGADSWGTTYLIDVDFNSEITGNVKILYDGDDQNGDPDDQFSDPDFGLRSPDNLDWADDGYIYLQEDRSIDSFGTVSGEEASIWKLDPESSALTRIAQMDRSAVPFGQTDPVPDDIGNWESSGIIDVSTLFDEAPGTLFIFDVQAHSLEDGIIEQENLVQGGQLAFLTVLPEEETELPKIVFGSPNDDEFDSAFPEDSQFKGEEQILFTGSGDDLVDVSEIGRRNRIYTGSGDDIVFAGNRNRISLGDGDDIVFAGFRQGANRITLGAGQDQFWVSVDDKDLPNNPNRVSDFNPEEDVIGFANTSLSLGSKGDLWNYEQMGDDVIISVLFRDDMKEIAQLLNTTITDANFVFA